VNAARAMRRPAVFIDKDGTLIDDVPYNVDATRMHLAAGVDQGLRRLAGSDYLLFVVSNQSGVELGLFPEAQLRPVHDWLDRAVAARGAELAGFSYCPHAPGVRGEPACDCRKPRPGMLLELAQRWNVDLAGSWMIGDILDDIEAGHRAGCRAILIDNGNETRWRDGPHRRPDFRAGDFAQAVNTVLRADLRACA
jgi:D-glycero-D-manno-heptose 1,7-bisphosphate phosphatase